MAEKQDLPQLVTEAGDKTDLEAGGASNGDSEDDSPFTSSRSACGHGTKRPRIRAKRLLLNLLLGLVAVAVVASHVRLIRATLRKHQAYRSVVPHKERPEISHDVEYAPLPQTADEPEQAHPTSGEDSEGWHEELPSLPVSPIPAAFGKDTGDGTVIARVSSKEEREDAPLREDRAPLVGVEKNTESAGETSITSEESASSNDEADIPPPALPDVPPVEAAPAEERDPLKDLEDELAALEVFINEGGPTTREPGSPPADTAASSHLREPLATIKESEAEEASDEATTVACKELATTGKEAALDTCCQSASDALPGPTETLKLPQQEVPLPEPPIEKKPQQRHRKAPKPPPNAPPPKPPPRPGPSPDSAEKQEVPTLISTLTESSFEGVYKVDESDLEPYRSMLEGNLEDIVFVQQTPIPKQQLVDFTSGSWLDTTVMHIYCALVAKHIESRVSLNLQKDVAVLSPVDFATMWQLFLRDHRIPVPSESDITRSQTASKVIFPLMVPLWDWSAGQYSGAVGHFITAVIDRENARISVVDSLPHPEPFYGPILEFLRHVAVQLHNPAKGPVPQYKASPHNPEPGFPLQLEAFGVINAQTKDYTNACGPFTLENILCIAENRKPNYSIRDAPSLRKRLLLELLNGLWDRPLLSGELRVSLE
ncbi:hypothetical protein, conserved [Eimeria tenella]|uniref:Ubiquitin-like protease family profile domain-containing protein n=1 Tax=Eimeria tenella TaxID=5802 RepID=U6KUZ2_EIMTE|nr:hypothetical protein, conserved [Eimeria tenella]CDJ40184.1 hypothetical protein, conserved [Eimeria tenella]|eukprot:XP_013230937.1 hypothetical protein, conserved [Eimeria tenella]